MSKLRSYAPAFIKRIVWNRKHRKTGTDPSRVPHDLLESLRTLEPESSILDLGCGAGNLRAALRLRGWDGHFVGVDVSRQVIDEVARKAEDTNAEWHVSALEDFQIPNHEFSTICLCESVYYVKSGSVPTLLERCRQSLVSGGRIVIRIWNADRHRAHITLLAGLGFQSSHPIYTLTKD